MGVAVIEHGEPNDSTVIEFDHAEISGTPSDHSNAFDLEGRDSTLADCLPQRE